MKTVLLVGLGNPGTKYELTRHNLGIRVVRAWMEISRAGGASVRDWKQEDNLSAEIAHVSLPEAKVLCVFPQTFMNSSGQAVAAALRYWDLSAANIIVVHDELELPFGDVDDAPGGSAHGHNGVRSIHEQVDTQNIRRLRIGIGRPDVEEPKDFVLAAFSAEEEKHLQTRIIPNAVRQLADVIANLPPE